MNNDMSSYFEDPEFKDLLAKYEGMAESHTPTYFDAEELTDIAEYYASQGDETKAEEAIDFALRLHPTNTDALVFKSRSLCIKGKLSEAYQIMNLIEDPSDREVQFLKADLLMEERRMEEADAIFEELAKSEDESLEVLLDVVLTYLDVNQQELAFKWITKIQEKGYNETNSQKYRDVWCDYCMTFGYAEKATNAFQLSLDELPYSIPHWCGLAKCYLAQNETEKAHESADFALAIDENNMEALEVKAFCHIHNENHKEALVILKQILPKAKVPTRIYALMAKCYLDLEMAVEAKETCKEWLAKCPKLTNFEKSEIFSYISMCCFNLHQPVEGMNYIDAALTMEPTFRGAILQKGMLHIELNEIEEAERLFKKVLDISPDDEQCEILYNIANCYFYLHKYPETITWCERIIQEYPEDQMEALHLMACSHFNMSDLESCLKCMAQIWTLNGFQFANDYSIDKRFKQMFLEIDKIIHQKNNQEESF